MATTAPIEVEAALQYGTKFAPFTTKHTVNGETVHTLTALGYGTAVVLMAAFVIVNYYGVRCFARINNALVWSQLFIILLVIMAFFIAAFHGENFSSHGFAPSGVHGIFTAIATSGIVFSHLGFRQGIELAGEADNPRCNVPIAVIGSVLLTGLIYVLLQVAFLPFPSWQQLVGFITSATVLSFASGPLVDASMRAQIPDQERPFRLPGGHTIPLLAFWGSNLIVYWSGWTTVWKLMIAVLIGFALLIDFTLSGQMKGKSLDVRSGLWVFPWLIGLTAISYLGNYPEPAVGNRDSLSFVVSAVLLLVLSGFVYVLAYTHRLPDAEAQAYIDEAAVEDKELSTPSP